MSKYLTPARICTLVLIELYQSNDFWIYHADTCTTVLELIAKQTLGIDHSDVDFKTIIDIPQNVLDYAKPLAHLDAELPGRSWSSILIRELWRLQTVDEFHDLFGRCMQLLVMAPSDEVLLENDQRPPMISRASPIGRFIRRCNVEFTRLQFADILALWHTFVAYREPSRSSWAHQYPELAQGTPFEPRAAIPPAESALIGTDTVSTILHASVTQLQSMGQRVPPEMRTKLREWLSVHITPGFHTVQYFMLFFDAWRAGQYNLALENLHRYYDYSVATASGEHAKGLYQYGLLHLSMLHADFHHWDESISAMKECIATARENQDSSCLNFALSRILVYRQWRHAMENTGLDSLAAIAGEGGTERDEITFVRARAREMKHWSVVSSTMVEEARHELTLHGVCAKAAELVLQSSHINNRHSELSMMSMTTSYLSAIYARLGQDHLSRNHQAVSLAVEARHGTVAERTHGIARQAYEEARRGRYADALRMIQEQRPQVQEILKLEQHLTTYADLVACIRAVRQSDMATAQSHISTLRQIHDKAEPDVAAAIDQIEITYLIKDHRLDIALSRVNAMIEHAKARGDHDVAQLTSLLIAKANIFAAAQRPTKGFSIALRAATTAQRSHMVPSLVEALHAVANILNDSGEHDAAQELCLSTLPHALEGSNTVIVAQLFVTLGEAFVGKITAKEGIAKTKQSQLAHIASGYIERAREYYRQLDEHDGQLDCLLMQARLARFTDDEQSASLADAKYQQLIDEHDEKFLSVC